jgi:arginase
VAIQVLGFPTTLGLPRQAVRHAPEVLRTGGLITALQRLSASVEDLGDLPLDAGSRQDTVPAQITNVVDAARRQADLWLRLHKPGHLMLTLGGDHTTSLGTIWTLHRMGQPFDVIWIDAHGDFNIIETSPSGNVHGMVLALACGLLPEYMPAMISPADLHLWGIRDLDPGERALLVRERVEVLDPEQTRHQWERIVSRLKPNVFLSFDLDSVEPCDSPGTMTPVPGGFRRQEALDMVAYLARHRHIAALDLVEFHPDQDQGNLTRQLSMDVATSVVTGQAARRHQGGLSAAAGN